MVVGALGSALGGIVGGGLILGGAAGKGGKKQFKEMPEIWRKLQLSNFDYRSLSAPEIQILSQAEPEIYDAVVPIEARTIVEQPEGREAQLQQLAQMQQIGREGLRAEEKIAARQAQRAVASEAQRQRENILRSLGARGVGGLSDEIQMRLAGQQMGSELAARQSEDLTRQQQQRRMAAIQAAAGMGTSMRGQDIDVASRNAAIMQRQNEVIAQMLTDQQRYAAAARERAQEYNRGLRQRVGETNVQQRYLTDLANIERQNRLREQAFSQRYQQTQGLSNTLAGYGKYQDRQQQLKAQGIMSLSQGVGGLVGSLAGSQVGGAGAAPQTGGGLQYAGLGGSPTPAGGTYQGGYQAFGGSALLA